MPNKDTKATYTYEQYVPISRRSVVIARIMRVLLQTRIPCDGGQRHHIHGDDEADSGPKETAAVRLP